MREGELQVDDQADPAQLCTVPGCCPVCGGPNACRMETGEAFKGLCWCAHLHVSAAALERLLGHSVEQRCLCRSCLERIGAHPEISLRELRLG